MQRHFRLCLLFLLVKSWVWRASCTSEKNLISKGLLFVEGRLLNHMVKEEEEWPRG